MKENTQMPVLIVEAFKEWKTIITKGYTEISSSWQFLILNYSNSSAYWKLSKIMRMDKNSPNFFFVFPAIRNTGGLWKSSKILVNFSVAVTQASFSIYPLRK